VFTLCFSNHALAYLLRFHPVDLREGILQTSYQGEACLSQCNNGAPQLTAEGAIRSEDRIPLLPKDGALQAEAVCLTLGSDCSVAPVEKLLCMVSLACDKGKTGTDLQFKPDAEQDENKMNAVRLGLDLNIVDSPDAAEINPFPYKKLGQSKVSDPSECGSTTGDIEESESHRKWREMKQNGFLSSSHANVVVPRPRGRPPKRKRDDELKKNTIAQNSQANKSMKTAAPSGLLSGLNPGIINHVRNSKQVYSIIKAMVHSENENQSICTSQTGEKGKEVSERIHDQGYGSSLMNHHFPMKDNTAAFHQGLPTASQFFPEDGDNLKLQLSSAATMTSDRTYSTTHDGLASNHDYMTLLSVKGGFIAYQTNHCSSNFVFFARKSLQQILLIETFVSDSFVALGSAASVASQWLELLHQDIRGRLAGNSFGV
jgi:hypothetical protein